MIKVNQIRKWKTSSFKLEEYFIVLNDFVVTVKNLHTGEITNHWSFFIQQHSELVEDDQSKRD